MPPLEEKDSRISEAVAEAEDQCFLDGDLVDKLNYEARKTGYKYEGKIVWPVAALLIGLHGAAVYGALVGTRAMLKTFIYVIIVAQYSILCVAGGYHRLWSHRAYKANYVVRLILMLGTTLAAQNHVIWWAWQHRCHHKWTDSDADPHNSTRGWFFSHFGWLMFQRHPKTLEMGVKIDLSDLEADELLVFQRKYIWPLAVFLFHVVSFIPWYFWNEDFMVTFFFVGLFRLTVQYHVTWTINSVSHLWGKHKHYNVKSSACDVHWHPAYVFGESWHNFHHAFPQDYRASEFAWHPNLLTWIINFCAWNGWVWDLKITSQEAVERQRAKFGDHLLQNASEPVNTQ